MDALRALPKAQVRVWYQQKDISRELSEDWLSLAVTDHLDGESDELEIVLEDAQERWVNDWYPGKGDALRVQITDQHGAWNAGRFEIDELEFGGGNPKTVTIRALATGLSSPLRTRNHQAHEQTTLADLAAGYAQKHGLKLVGVIEPVPVDRATQHHESDVRFLRRIAAEHGYLFAVKQGQLRFSQLTQVRSQSARFELKPMQVSSWRITDRIRGVYQAVSQQSHDPIKKTTVHHQQDAASRHAPHSTSADTLRRHRRTADPKTAALKAQAALDKANLEKTTGDISLSLGDTRMLAGVVVGLQGFGVLSGRYLIQQAAHRLDRSGGYNTDLQIQRVDGLPVLSRPQKKKEKTG